MMHTWKLDGLWENFFLRKKAIRGVLTYEDPLALNNSSVSD
jgi:hypothetical protein